MTECVAADLTATETQNSVILIFETEKMLKQKFNKKNQRKSHFFMTKLTLNCYPPDGYAGILISMKAVKELTIRITHTEH